MADDADQCDANESLILEAKIKTIASAAAQIPRGIPGECRYCGEESRRLVGGACAPCRDKRHLPNVTHPSSS